MELSVVVAAIEAGAFYALIALGYYLFVQATTALNFAMGAFVMAAGLTTAFLVVGSGHDIVIGTCAGLAVAAMLALVSQEGILRPMFARTTNEFGPLMAIVAFMFIIEQVAGLVYGRQPRRGAELVDAQIPLGRGWVPLHDVIAIAVTLLTFACVAVWLKKGRHGRMLRAVGDNKNAATLLGLPVVRVRQIAVSASGLVCGIAGVLAAPQTSITFQSDLSYSTVGFLAMVLGGRGSPYAPLLGGFLLAFFELGAARIIGPGYRDYALVFLVLAVFTFRPQGLITVKVRI